MSEHDEDVVAIEGTDIRPYPRAVLAVAGESNLGLLERLWSRLRSDARLLGQRDEARAWAKQLLVERDEARAALLLALEEKQRERLRAELAEAEAERLKVESVKMAGNFLGHSLQMQGRFKKLRAIISEHAALTEKTVESFKQLRAERDQLYLDVCRLEAEAFLRENKGDTYIN